MTKMKRLSDLSDSSDNLNKLTDPVLQEELLRVLTLGEYLGQAHLMLDKAFNDQLAAWNQKTNNLFTLSNKVEGIEITKDDLFESPKPASPEKIFETAMWLKEEWDQRTLK